MLRLDRPPLSGRANLAWAVGGSAVYTAAQWLVVIVLARLGDAEVTGYYSYALAVTGPIAVFANFNLRTIQATDVRDEYAFGDFFRLRSALLGAAAVGIGVAALVQPDRQTSGVLLLVGAARLVEGFSDVAHGLFQRRERMDLIGVSASLRGVLTVTVVALAYQATDDLTAACGAALAVTVLVAWLFDRRAARALLSPADGEALRGRRFAAGTADAARTRALFRLAWPLGVMALLDSLLPSLPRYYLMSHAGVSAVGVYSAVAYLMYLGNFFVTAVGQAVTPRLASAYHESPSAFRRVVWQLSAGGMALGIAGVLFAFFAGPTVLARVYGPAFAAHADLFVWVMVGAGIFYLTSLLWYAAVAARRIPSQAVTLAIAVAVTAVACAVLIPRSGLLGASWAVTCGFAVRLAGCVAALIGVRAPDGAPSLPVHAEVRAR